MSVTVYKITSFSVPDNTYTVGRSEIWKTKKDQTFSSVELAKDYIREQSRKHTDLPLYLINIKPEDREHFIDRFCFDDLTFLKHRRFFIGKPDLDLIKKHLKEDGINVLH
jgi:hypothetical protein